MSQVLIRQALEQWLGGMASPLTTANENAEFKPVVDTAYQRVSLLPATPDNAAIGGNYHREVGIFQVSLFYPANVGDADARERAELIKTRFRRGLRLTQDGLVVTIMRTPAIASGFNDKDRWVIPVSISYSADIFQ